MTEKEREVAIEKTLKCMKIGSILLAICLIFLCIVCYAQNVSSIPPAIPHEEALKALRMDEPSIPLSPIDESVLGDSDIEIEVTETQVQETVEEPVVEESVEEVLTEQALEETVETKSQAYSYTEEELNLLAKLIYYEAGGECYEGQVAVGAVVLNRVRASGFPNTIYDVIYAKGQFSPVNSSKWNKPVPEGTRVYEAAREALNGVDPTNGAVYFYNPKTSTSKWIFTRTVVKVIGNHNFAK